MTAALVAWLAAIAALVAVTGLLTAAETALGAASRRHMRRLARDGDRRAAQIEGFHADRPRLVVALRLGRYLSVALSGACAALALAPMLGWFAAPVAAAAVTLVAAIMADALPRMLAVGSADRTALALAAPVRLALGLFGPLARAALASARLLLRLFGATGLDRAPGAAEMELRGAIERHAPHGEGSERRMLRSILDLAEVEVGAIMIHRRQVVALDIDQRPSALLEQALASGHTRVPLWRGTPENIVGVLHTKRLLQALRAKGGNFDAVRVGDIVQPPWFVPESTTLLDQLEAFRRRRERFALFVDEYGALLGLVTLEDILEEIVGDIGERREFRVPGVRPQPDGTFEVDGHVTIRDLNREFDWQLPEGPAATIAGLVLNEGRRIPEVGQVFTFHGFRFEILRRRRNQITTLRITPPAPAAPERERAAAAT